MPTLIATLKHIRKERAALSIRVAQLRQAEVAITRLIDGKRSFSGSIFQTVFEMIRRFGPIRTDELFERVKEEWPAIELPALQAVLVRKRKFGAPHQDGNGRWVSQEDKP